MKEVPVSSQIGNSKHIEISNTKQTNNVNYLIIS